MQALFYGIGAAVIAIIARSAIKLTRMTLGRDRLLWGLFALSLVVTAWTAREIVWLFVVSGLIPLVARARVRALVDVPTVLICIVTLGVIIRLKRVPELALIAASGAVGLFLKGYH